MIIHWDVPQRSPEWFKLHLGKFTASTDFSIVANGLKYKQPTKTELKKNPDAKPKYIGLSDALEKLCQKKAAQIITGDFSDADKKGYSNFNMDRGIETENEAREKASEVIGKEFQEVGFVEINEYVGFSPDGIVYDPFEDRITDGLELKSKDDYVHLNAILYGDKSYKWQVGGSCSLSKADIWHFMSYNPKFVADEKRGFGDRVIYYQPFKPDQEVSVKLNLGLDEAIKRVIAIVEQYKRF